MSETLDRLAQAYGVELAYLNEWAERVLVSDDAKRGVLAALGVAAASEEEAERALLDAPPLPPEMPAAPEGARCFMPDWLDAGRAWGVTCQLYGLRSERDWGMGDFADLARFAEIAAESGADFVGVNPVHALFSAEPRHNSPFSPSNRSFLNPLYIAVDRIDGYDAATHGPDPLALDAVRAMDLVDYPAVAALKRAALEKLFARLSERGDLGEGFEAFRAEKGEALARHALFEALSERFVAEGASCGWYGWPEEFRSPDTDAVRAFAGEKADRVLFHAWLQYLADRQLGEAQAAAVAAGMRVGLYLDLAVGVAPDGSATWSDPTSTVPGARVGAPPGIFNEAGQDWGLAPLSPTGLVARDFRPFRDMMASVASNAGAVRIDHAMGLYRLYWVPEGLSARDGTFVRYPMDGLVRTLAEVSRDKRAIVIGEDLGTVPPGFREAMSEADIQSNRVLYFERREDHRFIGPHAYRHQALATLSTHDLPTLAGWWRGQDIRVRTELDQPGGGDVERRMDERRRDCRILLGSLADAGLLPESLMGVALGSDEVPPELPHDVLVATHRFMARTPCRLFGIQIEELIGAIDQPNLPGTLDEHPNWRRRMPMPLHSLPETPAFQAIVRTVAEERPR